MILSKTEIEALLETLRKRGDPFGVGNDPELQARHIGICLRCGAINPLKIEDCIDGAEIAGGGTEPHVFEQTK